MSSAWPDVKILAKLARYCGRWISLAVLVLALLAVSRPADSQLTAGTPAMVASKSIEATAILHQSIFPTRIVGSHSQPGWWRNQEYGGAGHSADGYSIVPVTTISIIPQPRTEISSSGMNAVALPSFRHFNAQAPPLTS